jgi:hypothetical protein
MKIRITTAQILAGMLILSACNFPLSPEKTPTPDVDLLATSVAGTVEAMMRQQPTMTVPAPTAEPTATLPVLQPTNTVSTLPQPTAAPAHACNEAVFVSETIPDGTQFELSQGFTKTWTVMNTGTCTWNTNYKWVFVSGDAMEAPASVNLTQEVPPNGQITISVPMKTPYIEGTYTGYWALQGEDGVNFFTNNSVKVQVTSDAFRVTSVTTTLKDHTDVDCPYDNTFKVNITTSTAGTIKYHLIFGSSDAGELSTTSPSNVKFDKGETKTIEEHWYDMDAGDNYWVKVYIDSPNNQSFGAFKFDITCK